MNLQYIKYALEIARTGSISKAAENLSVAQPNLSRAVKELETQLGIAIFERTRTGMTVTPEGERLLSAGERILRDVSELEGMFDGDSAPREVISVVAPHSTYLSHAFASFCRSLPADGHFDITYREGGLTDALGAVERGECALGIIRYAAHFEGYYTDLATQKGLTAEVISEFSPVVVAGLGSTLAGSDALSAADLDGFYEIGHPDALRVDATEGSTDARLRLTVTDRATRYELLASDPTAYQISAPLPAAVAVRSGLIQRPLAGAESYRDVLIYPKNHRLTPIEEAFRAALRESAKS